MKSEMSPYAHAWRSAHAAGFAPIPLPAGEKHPPPTGFTGGNAEAADPDQLERWENDPKYRNGNIAFWLGKPVIVAGAEYQVVGIDVDHYGDKHGGDQLAALEKELGSLSDREPWISTARTDGSSGIRWLLAPLKDSAGQKIEFRGKADSAIDVIQGKHRYAMVWPSVHPDTKTQVWWFPPGVTPNDGSRSAWRETDALPIISDFPILSDRWVTYLQNHRSHSGQIDLDISVTDLYRWADGIFNDGQNSEICWNIASALETWKRRITEDESSHDKITDAHWMLYRLAAEGHTGWKDAVAEVNDYWLNAVGRRGKRSLAEARAEIFRSETGALRKIKPAVDADGVSDKCACAGAGANLWFSDRVPLGLAHQFALAHEREDTPIKLWRDDWYQYNSQRWKRLSADELRKLIYYRLESAQYLNKDGIAVPWNPSQSKVATVEHALRAVTLLDSEDIEAPCWLDNRQERMVAFTNTLLQLEDRKPVAHTSEYFNMNALPFAYDPAAPKPERWLQFMQELWPDDPDSIAALQEWFGYVVSGRTNLHKMLTLIGPRRSGKTTIAHIMRSIVGDDNTTACRSADIVNPFGMADLVGRTLATFDDDRITGNGKKFVDVLKDIIGEGKVSVSRKYQSAWRGRLAARFVYIANELSAIPALPVSECVDSIL
ncbi:bifunctional DNA primase/polymerase, partial [Mycobacterium sp. M1]